MTLEQLEQNPYFNIVLDFCSNLRALDKRSPQRLVTHGFFRHENDGAGYETFVSRPVYEPNYAAEMELTAIKVMRIVSGKPTEKDLEALEHDLDYAEMSGLFMTDAEAFADLF